MWLDMQLLFSQGSGGDNVGVISVIGNGIFKCFRIVDNTLKLLPSALAKHDPQNYTAHAWMPEGEAVPCSCWQSWRI